MSLKERLILIVKNQSFLLKTGRNMRDGNLFKKSLSKTIIGKKNNIKINKSARLLQCKIDIEGDANEIVVQENVVLNNVVFYLRGNHNKIHISKNVVFNKDGSLWVEDDHCELTIGESTSFEATHIAVTEPNSKVTIGADCMFANDIDIRTGDSHSILDSRSNKRINFAANVHVGDHVWVGAHVSLLKGTVLLSNSIVATRSVVTKVFTEKGVLLAGTPAKVIKDNVTWSRERIYETDT